MRVPIKYDYRDLVDNPESFSGLEIVDAGSGEVRLSTEVLFFSQDFLLNTQEDGLGANITGFEFVQKNSRMTTEWAKDVYEAIQITDPTYQTGTIYAFGDIAGSIVSADDPNRLQDQIDDIINGTEQIGIGGIVYYAEQKARTSLFEFELDNAISQSTYSVLFTEIGHKYNDLHVLAGDADLSGSSTLFYPTPPPTKDGYLEVWKDWANITNTKVLASDNGAYKVTFLDGTSQLTAELTLNDDNDGTGTPNSSNSALDTDDRVQYIYSTNTWRCITDTSFDIVKIEKLVPETLSTDGHYGYIKAESITPSGEAVSALRYIYELIDHNSWNNQSFVVQHDLNEDVKNLIIQVWVRDENDVWAFVENITTSTASSVGVQVDDDDDLNSFTIRTLANGIAWTGAGGSLNTITGTELGSIRALVIKPNLITTYVEPSRTVYDISDSVDVTYNLPDASTVTREYTIKRRGSGTGKVLFSTQSSQTIEGLAASIWELEGEGEIVLFPYGGNWEVKHYEDSGSNANGSWQKYANGVLEQQHKLTVTSASGEVWTFPLEFNSTDVIVTATCETTSARHATHETPAVDDVAVKIWTDGGAGTTGVADCKAVERWRAA